MKEKIIVSITGFIFGLANLGIAYGAAWGGEDVVELTFFIFLLLTLVLVILFMIFKSVIPWIILILLSTLTTIYILIEIPTSSVELYLFVVIIGNVFMIIKHFKVNKYENTKMKFNHKHLITIPLIIMVVITVFIFIIMFGIMFFNKWILVYFIPALSSVIALYLYTKKNSVSVVIVHTVIMIGLSTTLIYYFLTPIPMILLPLNIPVVFGIAYHYKNSGSKTVAL